MEKERYEINNEDCLIDTKENKYVCDFCELTLFPDIVVDLLNQQDARIKELEEENQQLKEENNFLEKRNEELTIDCRDFCLERNDLFEENQQLEEEIKQLKLDLGMFKSVNAFINSYGIDKAREALLQCENKVKQSQNQKAIEVLEDINKTIRLAKELCGGKTTDLDIATASGYNRCMGDMQKIINDKIKELRSEK